MATSFQIAGKVRLNLTHQMTLKLAFLNAGGNGQKKPPRGRLFHDSTEFCGLLILLFKNLLILLFLPPGSPHALFQTFW
jgi:hypothetical protein